MDDLFAEPTEEEKKASEERKAKAAASGKKKEGEDMEHCYCILNACFPQLLCRG